MTVRIVHVVYDQRRFESLLWALFSLYKYKYYIGCYAGAPEVIPVLNVMAFDNEHYIIGGYYGPSARGDDRNLYVRHELIGTTIRQYFEYLWSRALLLNDRNLINWVAIREIGLQIGCTVEEINSIVRRIADETGFDEVQTIE